jgi:RNA recognition motif-containing protein
LTTDPASDVAGKYVPPWTRNKSTTETYSGIPTTLEEAHESDINLELIPKQPPYTVHLSNVSSEADEENIKAFFKDLKVLAVRLPVDERNCKKGFGDVEFEDRESLIAALTKKDTLFNGRPIKIRQYWREDGQQQQWRGDFSQRDS